MSAVALGAVPGGTSFSQSIAPAQQLQYAPVEMQPQLIPSRPAASSYIRQISNNGIDTGGGHLKTRNHGMPNIVPSVQDPQISPRIPLYRPPQQSVPNSDWIMTPPPDPQHQHIGFPRLDEPVQVCINEGATFLTCWLITITIQFLVSVIHAKLLFIGGTSRLHEKTKEPTCDNRPCHERSLK